MTVARRRSNRTQSRRAVRHVDRRPIWHLLEECATKLTQEGRAPFARSDLIDCVKRYVPDAKPDSINPVIQGITDNLRGGPPVAEGRNILHRVARGRFELLTKTDLDASAPAQTHVPDLEPCPCVEASTASSTPPMPSLAVELEDGIFDMAEVMEDLSSERPLFHSEADFQHALAWRIHKMMPEHEVRLEFKPPLPDVRMYLDLWLRDIAVAIELKYRTRTLSQTHDGETFALRNQAAQDISRYDFVKDIQRLEQVSTPLNARTGFAILLTNEPLYWTAPSRTDTVDSAFRLHEGRRITGEMAWSPRASDGTIRSREMPIRLAGAYDLRWRDYSAKEPGRHRAFRYLAVRVCR